MTATLPWYPPAPAAGPASLLSLPPDDWVMQPKIDGIRVIIYHGEPFNRYGQPLSEGKGALCLRTIFAGLDQTLDGEWVAKEGKYYAFDLPDQPGDLDDRSKVLAELAFLKLPGVVILGNCGANFLQAYATLAREKYEGVVLKRRASLYAKQRRDSTPTRDWLKRRFAWD
jgi:ATP-dependent DNA ligase